MGVPDLNPQQRAAATHSGGHALVLAGAGCLAGDTLVRVVQGGEESRTSIARLARLAGETGRLEPPTTVARAVGDAVRFGPIGRVWCSGRKATHRLITESGRSIVATGEHRFLAADGDWVELDRLDVGASLRVEGDSFVECETIASITPEGTMETYDIEMEDAPHNFIADGFVVHNSGKTTTLAHRVAWLVEEGVEPWRICAVTFTNRAARELVERVESLSGGVGEGVWATTFHSLCARALRIDGEVVGLPKGWSIADRDDSVATAKLVLRADDRDDAPAELLRRISKYKNAGASLRDCEDLDTRRLWKEYQTRLAAHGQLDFDDLLVAMRALLESPGGSRWRNRFQHVLVDEYQDTNPIQEALLVGLVGDTGRLWAVGDELQVLYRFRLAEVERILSFERRWAPSTVYPIEHNYRSQSHILEAANAVVERSEERTDKRLRATREAGTPVRLLGCVDGRVEAGEIARYVAERARRGAPSQCAILYRQHEQSRAIEHELLKRGVPYRVLGGTGFYSRAEVKHARALLGLLHNPRDLVAAERILLLQPGLGEGSLSKLRAWREAQDVSISEVMYAADRLPGLPAKASAAAVRIGRALAEARGSDASLLEVYRSLRDAAGLLEWARTSRERAEERVGNLGELESVLAEYGGGWSSALATFSETSALEEGDMRDASGEAVTLTTIHAAKGLEWEYVWVSGLEQELYVRDPSDAEDARRLVHVAITRAKDEAVLSYARERFRWGSVVPMHPLWLLDELPRGVERRESGGGPASGAGGARRPTVARPQTEAARPALAPVERDRALAWISAAGSPSPDPTASRVRYPAGAAVRHDKLGTGVVLRDDGERIVVRFGDRTKTLLKAYAGLERVR